MADLIIKDQKVYVGAYDITGALNSISLSVSAEELDNTALADASRVRLAGLSDAVLNYGGFVNIGTGEIDDTAFADVGTDQRIVSVAVVDGTDGSLAYTSRMLHTSYEPGGQVGEIYSFSVNSMGADKLIRGTILHAKTARTATGNGTGRQLGAVGATQKLYAALHVFAASGTTPSLTVKVQSDDNSGFTSATDRITFTPATAIGSQWATPVSGAITDDWWRITYTISGTGPSFTFVVVVGIQ